ncbi:MAG: hypothetical protein LH629_13330, partial [Ignavibacteria bacterium]|nr:hypothetical protein [Ignavibacteria bacterium]
KIYSGTMVLLIFPFLLDYQLSALCPNFTSYPIIIDDANPLGFHSCPRSLTEIINPCVDCRTFIWKEFNIN